MWASLVVAHRLSSCGARAQLFRGMWDLPRPALEPVSPALAGGFLTTAPPGKPLLPLFKLQLPNQRNLPRIARFSSPITFNYIIIQVFFTVFFFFFLFFLFLAVLGLCFCARAFSSCGKWGPLFNAVREPLTVAASLVAEHRLQTRRLSSCGSRAQLLRGMWDLPRPGLEPVSPVLAGRFSTTAPPGKPFTVFF